LSRQVRGIAREFPDGAKAFNIADSEVLGSVGDIADKVEDAGYRASALVVIGDAVAGAG
jgi:precorrin-4 methylase